MPNQERMVNDFSDLVRIDSPSGEEWDVALHVSERLSNLGFHVARDDHGNVIAREDGDTPLILSAHMDTVDPGRSIKPQVVGDRITSDGSTILGGDCKAGVAAILEALESVKEEGRPRRTLEVILTRGEEIGLVGASNLDFSMIRGREAVVFDGNGPVNTITGRQPHLHGLRHQRAWPGRPRRCGAGKGPVRRQDRQRPDFRIAAGPHRPGNHVQRGHHHRRHGAKRGAVRGRHFRRISAA